MLTWRPGVQLSESAFEFKCSFSISFGGGGSIAHSKNTMHRIELHFLLLTVYVSFYFVDRMNEDD